MRLTVFNCSPRGKTSNTRILLEHFSDGFTTTNGNSCEIAYLNPSKSDDELVRIFQKAEHVLLAFPLYTDAMPGRVKAFIESLEHLCGAPNNPKLAFLLQSGLPEAHHSRYLERYLEKLAQRLGCVYTGTIVKGGIEGIQKKPSLMNRKTLQSFRELGINFGKTGMFDERLMARLANPEKLSVLQPVLSSLWWFMVKEKSGLNGLYWNIQLKKNGSFEKRFARPYTG